MNTESFEKFEKLINQQSWFHSIDFGNGLKTPSRFSEEINPNWTLFGAFKFLEKISFSGLDCLDIGAFDGITSLILKSEGANKVLATDIFDLETIRLGREILNLDFDYLPNQAVETLPEALPGQKFDLVVMTGVLYHLYSPLTGISNCRQLTKHNGLFIIETEVYDDPNAELHLNSTQDEYSEPYTYWRPTVQCLKDMLKFCCYEVIAEVGIKHRHTILARAVRPSEIKNKTKALDAIHNQLRPIVPGYLNFKELESDTNSSEIKYSEVEPFEIIRPESFNSKFKLQPYFQCSQL